jgi:hypothetical protein
MIKTGIQWANKDGKDYWYVWVDIAGNTFRSKLFTDENWAKELLAEIRKELNQ